MRRIVRTSVLLSILACVIATAQTTAPTAQPTESLPQAAADGSATQPSTAKFEIVATNVERAQIQTRWAEDAPPMNVWVYRAVGWKDGQARPCVLISSSGSTGVTGMKLTEDDDAEHIPYVEAGCFVVAYDTAGVFGEGDPPQAYVQAMRDFLRSGGGVENARAAIRAAEAVEPRIDESRLLAAGHGAAANVALLLAASDARIRAVVAFAPISDLLTQVGPVMVDALDQTAPGFKAFVTNSQPLAIAPRIHCPTMIFHAADDPIVNVEQSRQLVAALKEAGANASLVEPAAGGHVRAMLETGLRQSAAWVEELARRMPRNPPTPADTQVAAPVDP